MQLPFTDLFTNLLGVQSLAQFGVKQAEEGHIPATDDLNLNCDAFVRNLPATFSAGAASVVYVQDNLAVVPEHWRGEGVGKFLTLFDRSQCRLSSGSWKEIADVCVLTRYYFSFELAECPV